MTQLQGTLMPQLNESIWNALELVQLRQTPWHKKQLIFDKLQSLGLIEPIPQKTLAPSQFPAPLIAALTENGRQALELRSGRYAEMIKLLK